MIEAKVIALVTVLLSPVRAYFQPGHPVEVTLDKVALVKGLESMKLSDSATLKLLLLSPQGKVVASADLDKGEERFDLAKKFPGKGPGGGLWSGQTYYVQVTANDQAIGSPLTVVPLLPPNPRLPRDPHGLRIEAEKQVVLHTTAGDIVLSMSPEAAPNTAMHFQRLVADGFYSNVIFHRLVPEFVIQGGDPTGTGMGGPGYYIDLEPSAKKHEKGTLSMARSGDPNSNGSQFFICLTRERCAPLDSQYTAFGNVVEGWPVVEKIAAGQLADQEHGTPVEPVTIQSAELIPAPARTPSAAKSK